MSEYAWLAIACGAATYVWRGLGVAVSARIAPEGELFAWIGCVAFAMLAGLISRMLLLPTGALAETELWQRLAATVIALAAFFFATRKNLFAGVIASGAGFYVVLRLSA